MNCRYIAYFDLVGEGFEQNFYYLDEYDTDEDGNPVERMCSFDWYDNNYTLYRYGTHFSSYAWKEVDRFAGVWEENGD